MSGERGGRRGYLAVVEPITTFFHYLGVAHRMGLSTLVLTRHTDACRAGEQEHNHSLADVEGSHIDVLVECDTGNADEVLRAIRAFGAPVAGVIPGDDHFVPVAAAVGRALGYDYAHPDDAEAQQRKSRMKERMAAAGVATPAFAIALHFDEAAAAWERFGRDCIVKMVDYQGSMNVFRVRAPGELRIAWDTIRDNLRNLELPVPRAPEVLVEEYLPGRELSAEGYVHGEDVKVLNFSEKITAPNFVVVGHFMPARLSQQEAAAVRTIVQACVRALGMRDTVFHVEVHVKDGSPYVIEAAARPPGQHMVELMARAYGWDLIEIAVELAVGATPLARPVPPRTHYSMQAFYAERTGPLARVRGLDALRARPDLLRLKLDLPPGTPVRALETFRDRYGFVVTEHACGDEARQAARWIRENVVLEVDGEPAPR